MISVILRTVGALMAASEKHSGRLQTSTLRRRINQRDLVGVAFEQRRWVYGGGRVLPAQVCAIQKAIEADPIAGV